MKKIRDVTYRIQESPRSKPKAVHSDRLKPYKGGNKPDWMIRDLVPGEVRHKTVALDGVNIHLEENRMKIWKMVCFVVMQMCNVKVIL